MKCLGVGHLALELTVGKNKRISQSARHLLVVLTRTSRATSRSDTKATKASSATPIERRARAQLDHRPTHTQTHRRTETQTLAATPTGGRNSHTDSPWCDGGGSISLELSCRERGIAPLKTGLHVGTSCGRLAASVTRRPSGKMLLVCGRLCATRVVCCRFRPDDEAARWRRRRHSRRLG